MKSIIKNAEVQQEVIYPCLKEYCGVMLDKMNFIVLFTEDKVGTVVESENSPHHIGYYCEYWHVPDFKPFTGTVELSNQC